MQELLEVLRNRDRLIPFTVQTARLQQIPDLVFVGREIADEAVAKRLRDHDAIHLVALLPDLTEDPHGVDTRSGLLVREVQEAHDQRVPVDDPQLIVLADHVKHVPEGRVALRALLGVIAIARNHERKAAFGLNPQNQIFKHRRISWDL